MEDYIVRIYRRKEEDGGLFGVVEEVGVEGQKPFRSMEELVRLLRGDPQEAGPGSGPAQAGSTGTVPGARRSTLGAFQPGMQKEEAHMYKNVLLMRNGCEGCSMETCLGVLLAESLDAKITAVYVTERFTWKELRKIYGVSELKSPGAARASKEAMANAEKRKVSLAKEALGLTEKMCADRQVPCETVHFSSRSPLHGVLKVAEEKRCDVIVTSTDPQAAMNILPNFDTGWTNGKVRIPMLFHHTV